MKIEFWDLTSIMPNQDKNCLHYTHKHVEKYHSYIGLQEHVCMHSEGIFFLMCF